MAREIILIMRRIIVILQYGFGIAQLYIQLRWKCDAFWTGKSYPSNFKQYPPSLYRIENTCPFTATNLVDQISFPKDNMWNFVYEYHDGGSKMPFYRLTANVLFCTSSTIAKSEYNAATPFLVKLIFYEL